MLLSSCIGGLLLARSVHATYSKMPSVSEGVCFVQKSVRVKGPPKPEQEVVFVHVGKVGGSSVEESLLASGVDLKPLEGASSVPQYSKEEERAIGWDHQLPCKGLSEVCQIHVRRVHLSDITTPVGKKIFIVVRDPLDRFISAFYWRQWIVENRSKHYQKIVTTEERTLFKCFPTVNQLGEALSHRSGTSPSDRCVTLAKQAAWSKSLIMSHITAGFRFYLPATVESYLVNHPDTYFLVRLDHLEDDVRVMRKWAGLRPPPNSSFPDAMGFPPRIQAPDKSLSQNAKANIQRALQSDYEVVNNLMRNHLYDHLYT